MRPAPNDNWKPIASGAGYSTNLSSKERRQARLEKVAQANREKGKRSLHVARVASLPPMGDPREELLDAAQSGDRSAVSRAVNLYGPDWKALAKRLRNARLHANAANDADQAASRSPGTARQAQP